MFNENHKLHLLSKLVINDIDYSLCYFWADDSLFSVDYRRCFVLLPSEFLCDGEYEITVLVPYVVSFELAKILFNNSSVSNDLKESI